MFKMMLFSLLLLNTALFATTIPEQTGAPQNNEQTAPDQNGTSAADEIKLNPNDTANNNAEAPTSKPIPEQPITTPEQPINCNYKIPADVLKVDETLVTKWSEQAAVQSFTFDYKSTDQQLALLKACFTDQGWQSFNEALQKSNNIKAIKEQELMVSSMVEGQSTSTAIKDNQWKINVPLQVVYQNSKQKITQRLNVDLIVGRKSSGDLGIMQMIASPGQPATPTITQAQ